MRREIPNQVVLIPRAWLPRTTLSWEVSVSFNKSEFQQILINPHLTLYAEHWARHQWISTLLFPFINRDNICQVTYAEPSRGKVMGGRGMKVLVGNEILSKFTKLLLATEILE